MPDARTRKRWRTAPRETADNAAELGAGLPPLIATLLRRRGVTTAEQAKAFLDPKLTDLHDPALLPGASRAAQRIAQAIRDQQRIVIYGDYDVDGITASAILWHTLSLANARVETYVPHRIDEGYGINSDAIRAIVNEADQGQQPPVIISVDCGITAVEPARVARELGVDLIVTDHHEFNPDKLPDAHTLVHPRLSRGSSPGNDEPGQHAYPFSDLCGAGVAFKLAWEVCKAVCGAGRLPQAYRDLLLDLLSLAALGTVADVVPLKGENRVITSYGLQHIKRTRNVGLNALIDASGLRDEKIDAYDVGFKLGPRINASGRMGHAKEAVHLLTTATAGEAKRIALFLTGENEKRRATERAIFDEAKQMVVESGFDREDCRAIVLGKKGWHPGVVGIVASRIVEAFSRPAVLLCYSGGSGESNGESHADDTETLGEAQGSARSVEGVSIHEAIHHCAAELTSYGGHAMAAGLRLEVKRVESFRAKLVEFVNGRLPAENLVSIIDIDAACTLDDLSDEFFRLLDKLAPFGRDNPAPKLLLEGMAVDRPATRMGGEGKHLSVSLRQSDKTIRAVGFGMGDLAPHLAAGVKLDAVAEPVISKWQGVRRFELHLKDLRVTG